MAGRDHNFTRRAVLGAAFAVPALGAAQGAGRQRRWWRDGHRAIDVFHRAQPAMDAFERRCHAAGVTRNIWQLDERRGDHLGAFISALLRLMRTPAPDFRALALKIELTVDHDVATLTGGERCLAALKADARRLTRVIRCFPRHFVRKAMAWPTASRILHRNEKAKAWSTVIANLGSALIASAFGRLWIVGSDPWVTIWGAGGLLMVLFGVELLNLLEVEE